MKHDNGKTELYLNNVEFKTKLMRKPYVIN